MIQRRLRQIIPIHILVIELNLQRLQRIRPWRNQKLKPSHLGPRLEVFEDMGDRIYVLENGRIAQEGSFTQLAQQKGLFAQLIARQTL
jgi:hypothetical protein